jgi:peptidoglycan/LPS O-acetylase OafA/YrhL
MKRVATLDGLRGIAIIMVVAGHAWGAYGDSHNSLSWLAPVFANASLGVRLFFVLSGYLITTLLLEEEAATGKIALGRFYVRRILRIFPAFYVYLGCIFTLAAMGVIAVSRFQLVAAFTYTWNYVALWHRCGTPEGSWFLGHLWTLSLEEQFYLFWPAALLILGSRKALGAAIVLAGSMPLVRVCSYFLFPGQRGQLGMMFHTAIDSIMIGCALALAMRTDRFRGTMGRVNWTTALPAVLAYVFFISPFLGERFRGGYTITFGFTLDAICVAILIFKITSQTPGRWLERLLSFPFLVFIGRLSYSLYLWQQLFLTSFNRTWSGVFPMSILCAFVAAIGSHYLIERPFLRLKGRFSGQTAKIEFEARPETGRDAVACKH